MKVPRAAPSMGGGTGAPRYLRLPLRFFPAAFLFDPFAFFPSRAFFFPAFFVSTFFFGETSRLLSSSAGSLNSGAALRAAVSASRARSRWPVRR